MGTCIGAEVAQLPLVHPKSGSCFSAKELPQYPGASQSSQYPGVSLGFTMTGFPGMELGQHDGQASAAHMDTDGSDRRREVGGSQVC